MADTAYNYNNAAYYDHIYNSEFTSEEDRNRIFFGIAQCLEREINPKTVLDVGCALGGVVHAFRRLGIESYGIDISEYAVSAAPEEIRPYLNAQSALAPLPADFPARFDLVICMEVAEHMPEEEASALIGRLCELGDTVVFSSSPCDFEDKTHYNVQQAEYWCKLFAKFGYFRCLDKTLSSMVEWTMCFTKMELSAPQIVEMYERGNRIADLLRKRPRYRGILFFDRGAGLETDAPMPFEYVAGEAFSLPLELNGVSMLRVIPMLQHGCLIEKISLVTPNRALSPAATNGLTFDGVTGFPTTEPFVDFDLSGVIDLHGALEAVIHPVLLDQETYFLSGLSEIKKERDQLAARLSAVEGNPAWRLTAPLRAMGKALRKLLNKLAHNGITRRVGKLRGYIRQHGFKTVMKSIVYRILHRPMPAPAPVPTSRDAKLALKEQYTDTTCAVQAIPAYLSDEKVRRLNLVTDSLEANSLLGGVATALIVATIFCEKNDYELRIITRRSPATPINYENIVKLNNLKKPRRVTYFSDFSEKPDGKSSYKIDITQDDIFFATSWWSAEAIRRTTLRKRFFYIIHEVETYFYNFGGERVMCESVMNDPNIDFIINSHYLNDYFKENEPNVYGNGVYFEPAFSQELFHPAAQARSGKKRLFFYGRPGNPRNLFNLGVNILDKAIQQNVIDTDQWEICLAGANVPVITFCNGKKTVNMGQLSWQDYAEFLRTVDVALCLMYTPHPSYPPYDAACSGGVVVTNRHLNKRDFPQCKNVLMADLNEESLLETLREGIRLSQDKEARARNCQEAAIPRDWEETLADTLRFMEEKAQ